jgi:hypothetical protein
MQVKIIKGFENYSISENGEVINILKNKVLKANLDKDGYLQVTLYNDEI